MHIIKSVFSTQLFLSGYAFLILTIKFIVVGHSSIIIQANEIRNQSHSLEVILHSL